jgi:hypothetical protein
MSDHSVILFNSSNYAIRASNILKKNEIEHKMIPVPRHLSSDCGYCVRISSVDETAVRDLFEKTAVDFERFEKI